MVEGSWKCPLSRAEFSAWLSCKYPMLNHLCCGKTGTESPRSLMEFDECVAFVHLEEKHALKSNRRLTHEREKLKHTVTGQFETQYCYCAESSRALFAGELWPHSAGLEVP